MGIVPVSSHSVDSFSSHLLTAALVDHLCSLYVQDPAKKDKLFQSMFSVRFHFICFVLIHLFSSNDYADYYGSDSKS